ncbi:MAG TPA: hypothetical protein VED85_02525, partial [Burkholderiaceae bacterium]|nr:hypothetical protein [Burkholderiaceae bacterium]
MILKSRTARRFGILAFLATLLLSAVAIAADEQPLTDLLGQLPAAGYVEKQQLIQRLAEAGDPRARNVLAALLDGNLVYRGADNRVFLQDASTGRLTDPLSGQDAGTVVAEDLTKVGI